MDSILFCNVTEYVTFTECWVTDRGSEPSPKNCSYRQDEWVRGVNDNQKPKTVNQPNVASCLWEIYRLEWEGWKSSLCFFISFKGLFQMYAPPPTHRVEQAVTEKNFYQTMRTSYPNYLKHGIALIRVRWRCSWESRRTDRWMRGFIRLLG